jgi:hypothetical protein
LQTTRGRASAVTGANAATNVASRMSNTNLRTDRSFKQSQGIRQRRTENILNRPCPIEKKKGYTPKRVTL